MAMTNGTLSSENLWWDLRAKRIWFGFIYKYISDTEWIFVSKEEARFWVFPLPLNYLQLSGMMVSVVASFVCMKSKVLLHCFCAFHLSIFCFPNRFSKIFLCMKLIMFLFCYPRMYITGVYSDIINITACLQTSGVLSRLYNGTPIFFPMACKSDLKVRLTHKNPKQ